MKLGAAILERDKNKQRLELLETRVREDYEAGRPLPHLREEIQRTANRWRDLEISIAWTKQQVAIRGLSLGSYIIRQEVLQRLADIIEPVDREKADEFLEAAHADTTVVETAIWLVDLQVPSIASASEENSETEEE